MNSQKKPEELAKKIIEEIGNTNQALVKLKEAEVKLHEIKLKLEMVANIFQENDQRKLKMLKNSQTVLPIFKEFETLMVENILPNVRASKTRLDPALYRTFTQKEQFLSSVKVFRDEMSSVLKDSTTLQNYKTFQEAFRDPEKGMIEFPFEFITGVIDFVAMKERLLQIRFDKSFEFHELPETFFICLVRLDLITITLTLRKVQSFSQRVGHQTEAGESDKKGTGNRVALFNIVYSNLFDHGDKVKIQSQKEPFHIFLKEMNAEDEDFKGLIQIIKENETRINLPCLYPSMVTFQRFSFYSMEKIERFYKNYRSVIDDKTERLEGILTSIIKTYPDEFTEAIAGKCFLCKKKFAMDSKSQKMLPPLMMKSERKEKIGVMHLGCRQMFENTEADEPQIIVRVDCPDESDLFLQNLM